MRSEVEKLDRYIASLQYRREQLIDRMQNDCPHPVNELLEMPFQDRGWLGSDPPIRVCKRCGLAEQGWGCGYWHLKKPNTEIPRVSMQTVRDWMLRYYTQKEMNELRRQPNT